MSFEGFTPKQEKAAEDMLKESPLESVGFAGEGLARKSEVVMESFGGEYNPYTKKEGTGTFPEGERGERMISDEEAEEAAKRIKGTEAEKWKLI